MVIDPYTEWQHDQTRMEDYERWQSDRERFSDTAPENKRQVGWEWRGRCLVCGNGRVKAYLDMDGKVETTIHGECRCMDSPFVLQGRLLGNLRGAARDAFERFQNLVGTYGETDARSMVTSYLSPRYNYL